MDCDENGTSRNDSHITSFGIYLVRFLRLWSSPLGAFIVDEEAEMAAKQIHESALNQQNDQQDESNTVKNPDEWKTGDEPMTGAQRSYLKTLSDEAKVPFEENLTKAEASKRIDELRQQSDRVAGAGDGR
jgi:hypothetical protein